MSEVKQANMCVTPEQTLRNLVGVLAILTCFAKNYDADEAREHLKITFKRRVGCEPFTYGRDFNVSSTYPAGLYLIIEVDWGYFPKKVYKAAADSAAKAMIWSTKTEYQDEKLSHYEFRLTDKDDGMEWIEKIENVQNLFDDVDD